MITAIGLASPRRVRKMSKPSRPGSSTSRIIRSNWPVCAWASASRPSANTVIANPGRPKTLLDERGNPCLIFGNEDSAHFPPLLSCNGCALLTSGTRIVKVDPSPGAPDRSTVPPWASAIATTMDRPSPDPSMVLLDSRRVNRSKIRSRTSVGMPGPSSRTDRFSQLPVSVSDTSAAMTIGAPGVEYLTALSASCGHAWVMCPASMSAGPLTDSTRQERVWSSAEALAPTAAVNDLMSTSAGSTKCGALDAASSEVSRDQRAHPIKLLDGDRPGRLNITQAAGVEQLQMAANDRDRCLQLVTDVVEQAPLAPG